LAATLDETDSTVCITALRVSDNKIGANIGNPLPQPHVISIIHEQKSSFIL
jgi:hypothetical protein